MNTLKIKSKIEKNNFIDGTLFSSNARLEKALGQKRYNKLLEKFNPKMECREFFKELLMIPSVIGNINPQADREIETEIGKIFYEGAIKDAT